MLFNSIEFLLFFILVTVIYFALPHKLRWLHLLISSCVFYCAFIPIYILILAFTIIIDYYAGIFIEQTIGKERKILLLLSIIANIGILAFFKYYNFFIDNFNALFDHFNVLPSHIPYLNIILPIGLSFHTFQALSYTIEVYRGNRKPERHFGIYALYVMFYPQLVAGPIERPQNLLHQFHEKHFFDFNRVVTGIQQILWGLFKKAVVGDLLGKYVDSIYDNHQLNTGFTLLAATYAFAFQIYCDFSGYSDMALGTARVMGFDLMDNFSLPYFSKSITEFWRRWHISLSSWLKDYLYISLGGNRKGQVNTYKNLLITMFLGGLWHGASWNFAIWGFLNGIYLSIEKLIGLNVSRTSRLNPMKKILRTAITFHLICFTWIFFRAKSLTQSIEIIQRMFDPTHFFNLRIQDTGIFSGMTTGLIIMLCFEYFYLRKRKMNSLAPEFNWLRSISFIVSITLLIIMMSVSDGDQFIYFQF